MIDHLRALAVFSNVADAGSFSAAAKRLGLSSSVVSHHVTVLERHLNTALIYRTTRKLSLTSAGETLAVSARDMLRAAEQGFGQIGHDSGALTGSLKITAPAILQYARFMARVSTFKRHNPKVALSINFTDRQVNIVQEGIDLAFRVGVLKDSSLISRKFADGRVHICASPDYVSQIATINDPDDLDQLELIHISSVSNKVTLTHATEPQRKKTVRMPFSIMVDSGFAARRMAEEGCGVAILPDFFVRDSLDEGRLVELLPKWHAPAYGIFAVWPPNAGANHTRTSFLRFTADIVKTNPEADRDYVQK